MTVSEYEFFGVTQPAKPVEDKPEEGKQYLLIGGTDKPSIANGNSWKESEVKQDG